MPMYELKHYGRDAAGKEVTEYVHRRCDASIRSYAGRLSKVVEGPVDIAHYSNRDWNERYITTAMPSEYHVSGYRLERLT